VVVGVVVVVAVVVDVEVVVLLVVDVGLVDGSVLVPLGVKVLRSYRSSVWLIVDLVWIGREELPCPPESNLFGHDPTIRNLSLQYKYLS
jgi:hypothetical protein